MLREDCFCTSSCHERDRRDSGADASPAGLELGRRVLSGVEAFGSGERLVLAADLVYLCESCREGGRARDCARPEEILRSVLRGAAMLVHRLAHCAGGRAGFSTREDHSETFAAAP